MAEPINLNRARKARDKTEAKATAVQNRAKSGATKADRALAERLRAKMAKTLDDAKREP